MKVLLYSGSQALIERSGVGRAIHHQKEALTRAGVDYTTEVRGDWDIVHINTIFPASFLLALRARLSGKGVVYHGHSTDLDFRNSFVGSNFAAPLFKQWLKLCYGRGDMVVAPTPYAAEVIRGYDLGKSVVSVSNGIDLDFYQRDESAGRAFREKYGFQETDKVVLSVGLPIDRKGVLDFIQLATKLPQYQFVWFGDLEVPMLPHHIKEALKTDLPNLHFPGYIRKEELRGAYCGSDVFLFLTKEETEGIVLLEALAMGCPVLVRDIPIYKTWLEDGRDVIKAGNVNEFCEKLQDMLEGETAKRLGNITAIGYQVAVARSMDAVGLQLKRVYESVWQRKKMVITKREMSNG